ncbi:MAG TPA: hypothetical protein VKJ00_00720 [Thermoanaerobaculia bacterium]|nr:hypothetical protein [Thermoanaerobaculia bacterium]
MKRLTGSLAVILAFAFAAPALGGGLGLSGPHFNVNIIGVDNPKTQLKLDGKTIFVALGKKVGDPSPSNIWLTPGPFDVCDGNGFTQAYDCSGNPITGKTGAVFQLPCDTNITTPDGCTDANGNPLPFTANYTVWVRALGQPGGSASMTLCAEDPLQPGVELCNTLNNVVSSGILTAHKNKIFTNVTSQLTVLHNVCFFDSGSFLCEDVSLFADGLVNFVWQYDNNGLRLTQMRFYLQD